MTELPALMKMFGDGDLAKFTELVLATGGLGLAASALLDATKVAGWGIARVGFPLVQQELDRYAPALATAIGPEWPELLKAHWINGRDKAEQKSLAAALIMLGLSPETAPQLQFPPLVDKAGFTAAVAQLQQGEQTLSEAQIAVIARFRTVLDSRIDAAFERAEQKYRNVARVWSGVIAVLLSVLVALIIGGWNTDYLLTALVIGAFAVPLAPIAKDLASGLSAAARALKSGR